MTGVDADAANIEPRSEFELLFDGRLFEATIARSRL
jgi:hypothetical protein